MLLYYFCYGIICDKCVNYPKLNYCKWRYIYFFPCSVYLNLNTWICVDMASAWHRAHVLQQHLKDFLIKLNPKLSRKIYCKPVLRGNNPGSCVLIASCE